MKILSPIYNKKYNYGSRESFLEQIGGVPYYRQVIPLTQMTVNYKDVEVVFVDGMSQILDTQLKGVDIVLISYSYLDTKFIKRCKEKGIKVVVDIDDDFRRAIFHENFTETKQKRIAERLETVLRFVDGLIVTTDQLKKHHSKKNKNIVIAENFVDDTLPAYNTKPKKGNKIRCGYAGGAQHEEDIKLIIPTAMNSETLISLGYFQDFGYKFSYYKNYPIREFPLVYDLWDITLVPVVRNRFTYYKSPLKIVESGFKHTPVVCSYEYPYKPYLKHKENCLIARTPYDFDRGVYWLRQHPEEIDRLGEALYETVKKYFDKHEITEKRYKFFKRLCGTSM